MNGRQYECMLIHGELVPRRNTGLSFYSATAKSCKGDPRGVGLVAKCRIDVSATGGLKLGDTYKLQVESDGCEAEQKRVY